MRPAAGRREQQSVSEAQGNLTYGSSQRARFGQPSLVQGTDRWGDRPKVFLFILGTFSCFPETHAVTRHSRTLRGLGLCLLLDTPNPVAMPVTTENA